jgi:hypothetical protein
MLGLNYINPILIKRGMFVKKVSRLTLSLRGQVKAYVLIPIRLEGVGGLVKIRGEIG